METTNLGTSEKLDWVVWLQSNEVWILVIAALLIFLIYLWDERRYKDDNHWGPWP